MWLPSILEKGTKICSSCGERYQENIEIPFYARYHPVAVFGECRAHGFFFGAPQRPDLDAIAHANTQRVRVEFDSSDFQVKSGPKSKDLIRCGVTNYLDLFSNRQLLYLSRAIDHLADFESLTHLNLGLLVSTSIELNSMLCGYKGTSKHRAGAIRHTFSHHAYSFPHTALENNPLYPANVSGSLQSLFRSRIRKGRKWALKPVERHIKNGKVQKVTINGEVDQGKEAITFDELLVGGRYFKLFQSSSIWLDLPDDCVD